MASIGYPYILDISDDVLLMIFSYLKGHDLANLAETCERFYKVAGDKTLWIDADFSGGCTSLQQFKRYLRFLTHSTKRLVLRGYKKKYAATPKWKTPMISAALLKLVGNKCPNLESLVIREGYVDANKLKIVDFENVPSLLSLRIEDCEFVNLPTPPRDGSYFKRTHKVLPRLEELNIIKCGWVDDYDVMVLSKADTLKRLTLRSLPRVGRAMAYLSLAFRFGFQNLEELDLRGTSLRDSEVNSIVQNGGLRALYIGPVDGRVVRLSEDTWSSGHNMVMPDPRRRQEERQQVVVINVGPDGPQWRQVRDEDLDGLGLQWVRNNPLARPQPQHDPDQHYFIGQDGRPIGDNEEQRGELEEENGNLGEDQPGPHGGPSQQQQKNQEQEPRGEAKEENGNHGVDQPGPHGGPSQQQKKNREQEPKRQVNEDDDDDNDDDDDDEYVEEDELQPPSKRRRLNPENAGENSREHNDFSDEDERRDLGDHLNHVENWVSDDDSDNDAPDEHLSDHIAGAFREHTRHLEKLVLSGCAITDAGLLEILRVVPSLRYLDVRNTRVTSNGLQQARAIKEDCVILDGNTRTTSDKNR